MTPNSVSLIADWDQDLSRMFAAVSRLRALAVDAVVVPPSGPASPRSIGFVLWTHDSKPERLVGALGRLKEHLEAVWTIAMDGTAPPSHILEMAPLSPADLGGLSHLPEDERVARVISLTLAGRTDQTPVGAGAQAVHSVAATVGSYPTRERALAQLVRTAIDHGAPIYDAGDRQGCAELYLLAGQSVVELSQRWQGTVGSSVAAVLEELAVVVAGAETSQDPRAIAWELRHCFDALIVASYGAVAAHAIEMVDERLRMAVRPLSDVDVRGVLITAIVNGAPAYNDGCEAECAEIYLHAAIQLSGELSTPHGLAVRASSMLRRPLYEFRSVGPLGQEYRWAIEHNASAMAQQFRRVFDEILAIERAESFELAARPRIAPEAEIESARVFVCYARADNASGNEEERWLDRLKMHLKPLVRQDDLQVWADTDLKPGLDWQSSIELQLRSAKVAVLLISPALLASDYVAASELPVLLSRASADGLSVLPIFVAPSNVASTRFKYPDPRSGPYEMSLTAIQGVNQPTRTLVEMSRPEQERLFVSLTERIVELTLS